MIRRRYAVKRVGAGSADNCRRYVEFGGLLSQIQRAQLTHRLNERFALDVLAKGVPGEYPVRRVQLAERRAGGRHRATQSEVE